MIRPARYSDLHQIRFLAQTAFAPYALRNGQQPEPLSADYRDLVTEGRLRVFMVENAVRGFVIFRIDGPDVHVEALAVAPRYRGRGIGRSLLDHADRQGLRAGCRRTVLYANANLFENVAYYQAKGFQEIDRRIENGFDRIYFERYLK